ncbi:hypothetical protein ACEXQE_13590 [Herbiconiux sp. P17]|uniref:hypothetical protein n=1 Tax=Herbiconiux wuyangfengii TaxID=3342794 RepID=UPI0035B94478
MTTAFQTAALTEPIDRRQYRDYQKRTSVPGRRLWPRALGLLGTGALIVFLSLYVTDWDLDRAPWFAIGIALLFVISWMLVRRATSRRRRLRYRLDRLARDNGWRLEHDVADPRTPGLLFRLGTEPVTVVRMSPVGSSGENVGGIEIGIHARTEASPTSSGSVVETLYVMGPSSLVALPPASVPALPDALEATPPGAAPRLDELPRAGIAVGAEETAFFYEDVGDRTICYLAELLDLSDPQTWVRISAVQNWIASRR